MSKNSNNSGSYKQWRKTLLFENTTIQDGIESLNSTNLQIVLVISSKGILLGTVTDGDIRRGLLNEVDIESPIQTILSRDSLVVPPSIDRDDVLNIMQVNKIHQIPVVDEGMKVVGLYTIDDLMMPLHRSNIMVIMAGGQGKRLRPYTENCPKPLVKVQGKPMLEHIIERAKAEGISHFVLAVHYLGHMIKDYFGDGSKWQVNIEYIHEDEPMGTAGAISLMNPKPKGPFLVTNGDVLTDIRYGELLDYHINNQATATMAVHKYEWQHPFGVVYTKGINIDSFKEKPVTRSYVNAGIYVLEPNAIDFIKSYGQCDMPKLFEDLQHNNFSTIVYPMHEPWLDVGRPNDLVDANKVT